MEAAIATGRKLKVLCLALVGLGQLALPSGSTAVAAWAQSWWTNRASIALFASVNTLITTASEAGSRTLSSKVSGRPQDRFFVPSEGGGWSVHRQSLINIFMTCFASLLGGPVYFFRRPVSRFAFFACFGALNSVLAQAATSLVALGQLAFSPDRMVFDLVYNGTFKFLMFELTRGSILKARRSFVKVTAIRSSQDFLTTSFRVSLLNWLGFRG